MSKGGADKKFSGLELLRFLCALTIVIWHYQHFFWLGPTANVTGFVREAQPLYALLFVAYNWGNYAVEVFWAISGFIFFWKYADAVHCCRTTGREFFILRFSRLYPLHLLTFLMVAALQWVYVRSHDATYVYAFNDLRHFVLNLFLASDWGFHQGMSFNGPVWSISVEILAYISFFLVARRWRLGPRLLGCIIVALILAKMAPVIKDITLCHLYFFVGGAVHRAANEPGARPGRAALWWALAAATLVAINWHTNGKVHTFALLAVSVALLFAFLALGDWVRSGRTRYAFSVLGNLTYSSYLLHFPLQLATVIVMDRLALDRAVFFSPWALAAFLGGVFAVGQLSFSLFEHPAQEWLRARMRRRLERQQHAGDLRSHGQCEVLWSAKDQHRLHPQDGANGERAGP